MKKVLLWLCIAAAVLSLSGCGIKEKVDAKIGEAIGEKILEGAADGSADVDIDGDKVKIKDNSGNEMEFGGTEWPDSDLAKKIPKFTAGKISSAVKTTDTVTVTLEEVPAADYETYFADIKAKFSENSYESTSEDLVTYGGADTDGTTVYLYYSKGESTLMINVSKAVE